MIHTRPPFEASSALAAARAASELRDGARMLVHDVEASAAGAVEEMERAMVGLEDDRVLREAEAALKRSEEASLGAFERLVGRLVRHRRTPTGAVDPTTLTAPALRSRILHNYLLDLRLQTLALVLAYASTIFYARWLGAEGYGQFSVISGIAMILAYVPHLGLATSGARFETMYLKAGDAAHLRGLLERSFQITLVNSLAILGLVSALALGLGVRGDLLIAFVAMGLLISMAAYAQLVAAYLDNSQHIAAALIPSALIVPLLSIVGAAVLRGTTGRLEVSWLVMTIAAATAVGLVVQLVLIHRALADRVRGVRAAMETRTWIRSGIPILVMTIFLVVVYRGDLLFVAAIDGATDAGAYAAALTTAEIVGVLLIAANAATTPYMTPLFAAGQRDKLQTLCDTYGVATLGPAILVGAAIIVAGPWILDLFGPGFDEAYPSLVLLTIAQVFKAQSGAPGYLLIMTGHGKDLATTYSLMVAVDLVLLVALVPLLGMHGAAVATLVAMVVSRTTLNAAARKRIGVDTNATKAALRRLRRHDDGPTAAAN